MMYMTFIFVVFAGALEGLAETLKSHYYRFAQKYPSANPGWWNPDESWRNKYKNGDPNQGEKFPGSTTFFVWLTDAYHMVRTFRNACFMLAIVLHASSPLPIWLDYLIHLGCYQIGFTLVYDIIFKK